MVQEIKDVLQTYLSKEEFEVGETIIDMVDGVCAKEIEPFAREMDQFGTTVNNGTVKLHPQMTKIVDTFRQNDLFGLTVPEEYDGSGLSHALGHGVGERVARADICAGLYLALQGTISDFILITGTQELKEKYLPSLAAGKRIGGILLTEPASGSDLGSVKSKAVRDGDRYIVNGEKIFITNCHVADTYVFLASTDPSRGSRGLVAFVLDTKDQSGFNIVRLENKMGFRASPTGAISLDNVEIPVENRIGEEGQGLSKVLNGLSASRIGIAAGATGIADAAYRKALAYAHERVQFGKSILKFQASQFKIADMATKIHLARNSYMYASRLIDTNRDFATAASIAKLFATEMAQQVTYDAIQLHGGYGFIVEYDVERYYRDARVSTIGEGTSEIQRLIISQNEIGKHTKN